MATIDNELIGSVLNAVPMDRMISGPLHAMVQAQVTASKAYADFLMEVCVKDGKAVAIQFNYDETTTDAEGNANGSVSRRVEIPLLAAVSHPNIGIEDGTVEFEMTISQMAESRSDTEAGASLSGSLGWGPFRLKMSGQVSHKSSQTRKTDTRARYAFSTRISRQPPSEALMRVIDMMTEAASRPVRTTSTPTPPSA